MRKALFFCVFFMLSLFFIGHMVSFAASCSPPGYCKEGKSSCPQGYHCANLGGGSGDCGDCGDDSRCCEMDEAEFSDCNPDPDPCGPASGCLEGQICYWYVPPLLVPGISQWMCKPDTDGVCNVSNCTSPNQCFDDSCPTDGKWGYNSALSCGVSGKICCSPTEITCSSPGSCMGHSIVLGRCPTGFEKYPGTCASDNDVCCVGIKLNPEPNEPKRLDYNGPVISDLNQILEPIAKILYYGGLFIGIFFIVLSGYQLMTSAGNPQATQNAQEQLTAAILGIIFILLSATILRVIINDIIGGGINI